MLVPLQQFTCDHCNMTIDSPADGLLQWLRDGDEIHTFQIIHNPQTSPLTQRSNKCGHDLPEGADRAHVCLNALTHPDYSLTVVLSIVDPSHIVPQTGRPSKLRDIGGYLEIIRRLHVPLYEEARQYFSKAIADGFITGTSPFEYSTGHLTNIIQKYGGGNIGHTFNVFRN